ncbi:MULTISPECIES: alkaline phosphatase [unclassified Halomonas]|uniref:alkaline phosphatase n=1 Tax=unclassified Halomonas TaxID=2609666 RepID=UPI002076AB25|nr:MULTISPECIES: alkaline phosphatase [unclassified Halomonas]
MVAFKRCALALALGSVFATSALAQQNSAKNVILMITDGAGIETFRAASYYRHGGLGHEVYDDFDTQVFAATYPLTTATEPTMSDEGAVTFDPEALWSDEAADGVGFEGKLGDYDSYFAGYNYARENFTDSAAAGTALATGQKTYNSAINWSNNDERMKNIGEYVVESGRALGVVSSVQLSHATPAAFLGHNASRNEYAALGEEIIDSGLATVVFGAGHPYFDDAGNAVENPDENAFRYVGGEATWQRLVDGDTDYQLIESRDDFEALADGELTLEGDKVLGVAQNHATLQFNRPGVAAGDLLDNVPSLPTLTRGALEVLKQNDEGFFLMVEGGAVDWAAHANNLPRLVEEQVDFNEAVEAAVEWVETNSDWDETMIIVTSDHGNGLLQGPDSDQNAYSPVVSQGAGALPLVRWHSDNHTRELVPLYAQGAGADYFLDVAQRDEGLSTYNVDENAQQWLDNTDVFRAAMSALGIDEDSDAQ